LGELCAVRAEAGQRSLEQDGEGGLGAQEEAQEARVWVEQAEPVVAQ
jgi:hypothetical protein